MLAEFLAGLKKPENGIKPELEIIALLAVPKTAGNKKSDLRQSLLESRKESIYVKEIFPSLRDDYTIVKKK